MARTVHGPRLRASPLWVRYDAGTDHDLLPGGNGSPPSLPLEVVALIGTRNAFQPQNGTGVPGPTMFGAETYTDAMMRAVVGRSIPGIR